jgi:hypothetical protein
MGYTIYTSGGTTVKEFSDEFLNDTKKIIAYAEEQGVTIRNGLGEGEPFITKTRIAFNGDSDTENDCETVSLTSTDDEDYEECHSWDSFTKTLRLPYTTAAIAFFIRAWNLGIISNFDHDDSVEAIEDKFGAVTFYNEVFPDEPISLEMIAKKMDDQRIKELEEKFADMTPFEIEMENVIKQDRYGYGIFEYYNDNVVKHFKHLKPAREELNVRKQAKQTVGE